MSNADARPAPRPEDPATAPDGTERRRRPRYEIEILGIVLELGPDEEFGPLEQVSPLEEAGLMDELGAIDEGAIEDAGRQPLQGRTRNVSLGGALVEIDHPIAAGTWIQLCLGIAEEPLEVRARVLACQAAEGAHFARVEFVNLAEPSQALLEAYIADWKARQPAD